MGCGGGVGDSGGGNGNVSSVAGGVGDGSGGDAARQREFPRQEAVGGQDEGGEGDKDEDDEDDLDDDEEEDEGWDVSLSNMVSTRELVGRESSGGSTSTVIHLLECRRKVLYVLI